MLKIEDINELKELTKNLEEELRKKEKHYFSLLDRISRIVCSVKNNQRFEALSGITEIIKKEFDNGRG